jgi:hypothetical protein
MTLNHSKMWFGFALLAVLCVLAIAVATGHVQDSTSFGPIITMLGTLSGAFAGWAFRDRPQDHIEPAAKSAPKTVDNGSTPDVAAGGPAKAPAPAAMPSEGK